MNYDELNPGIRKTVKLLNSVGWETTDSGDGETHDYECDRDVGYVVVVSTPQDVIHDSDLIHSFLESYGVEFSLTSTSIQATYSPVDGYAFVDIHDIHDRMLVK